MHVIHQQHQLTVTVLLLRMRSLKFVLFCWCVLTPTTVNAHQSVWQWIRCQLVKSGNHYLLVIVYIMRHWVQ